MRLVSVARGVSVVLFIGGGLVLLVGQVWRADAPLGSPRWREALDASLQLSFYGAAAMVVGVWVGVACLIAQAVEQSRRKGVGFCRNCGYDLRASPERCPECGTPVQ